MSLRKLGTKLLRVAAWAICRPLPVQKNKVVVSNFYGRGYADNPKAIVDELLARGAQLRIIWLLAGSVENDLPAGVEACPRGGFWEVYHLTTARVWIDNCRKGAWYKKKGQLYVQTWHGFALKQIERDVLHRLHPKDEAYGIRDSSQIDLLLSNSSAMTKIFQRCFWYQGEIGEFGSPRNDALLHPAPSAMEKVYKALGIPADRRIVLYAPTFREDDSLQAYGVELQPLRQALAQRFGGEWVVVQRLHPKVAAKAVQLQWDGETVLDATHYSDLQELLTAADAVVTDYSSLMFDFGLTGKPCFLYWPDLESYRMERNFYLELEELPFPQAQDNPSLRKNVADFDSDAYRRRLAAFYLAQGFLEDGQASRRTADWISEKMK